MVSIDSAASQNENSRTHLSGWHIMASFLFNSVLQLVDKMFAGFKTTDFLPTELPQEIIQVRHRKNCCFFSLLRVKCRERF